MPATPSRRGALPPPRKYPTALRASWSLPISSVVGDDAVVMGTAQKYAFTLPPGPVQTSRSDGCVRVIAPISSVAGDDRQVVMNSPATSPTPPGPLRRGLAVG